MYSSAWHRINTQSEVTAAATTSFSESQLLHLNEGDHFLL